MISDYAGLIECITEDFKDFCNTDYLALAPHTEEKLIKHLKYNFYFNHESPGHANLYLTEQCEFGGTHFTENNYQRFIKRYQARINNFRNYLNDPNNELLFIVERYNSPPVELEEAIAKTYPNLKFQIAWISSRSDPWEEKHINTVYPENHPERLRFKAPVYDGAPTNRCFRLIV